MSDWRSKSPAAVAARNALARGVRERFWTSPGGGFGAIAGPAPAVWTDTTHGNRVVVTVPEDWHKSVMPVVGAWVPPSTFRATGMFVLQLSPVPLSFDGMAAEEVRGATLLCMAKTTLESGYFARLAGKWSVGPTPNQALAEAERSILKDLGLDEQMRW